MGHCKVSVRILRKKSDVLSWHWYEHPIISNHWRLNYLFKSVFSCWQKNLQTKNRHYWPFVRGICHYPVDSPHKWPVMQKALPCHLNIWESCILVSLYSCAAYGVSDPCAFDLHNALPPICNPFNVTFHFPCLWLYVWFIIIPCIINSLETSLWNLYLIENLHVLYGYLFLIIDLRELLHVSFLDISTLFIYEDMCVYCNIIYFKSVVNNKCVYFKLVVIDICVNFLVSCQKYHSQIISMIYFDKWYIICDLDDSSNIHPSSELSKIFPLSLVWSLLSVLISFHVLF